MTRNKDFFRKPYMETPEDDYSDMMKYIPDAAQPDYRSKPHSEMLKPYDDRIRDYEGMEHFYPNNFNIPEQPPSIDADPISGEPNPCEKWRRDPARFNLGFGSKKVWYEVLCGGSLSIDNALEGGVPPYKSWGGVGSVEGNITVDEEGGLHYDAPKECCTDSWDNILIEDFCGNTTNILIKVLAFDYRMSNYETVIIGPDAPVNGDCYSLQTPVPGTIWTIDKGSIDSSGCVSGIDDECGVATITATFMCKDNEIVATKQVRMPLGVWIDYTFHNYGPCNTPSDTCTTCQFTEESGIYQTIYTNGRVRLDNPTGTCPDAYGCVPATHPLCLNEAPYWYDIRLINDHIHIWSCP